MRILFQTKKLQKVCSNGKEGIKQLGTKCGIKLQQRMMELSAATCLADISRLTPARCHELKGNRKMQLSVDLDHPYRLIFIPANDPAPLREDHGLIREKVTEIMIIEIVGTHRE